MSPKHSSENFLTCYNNTLSDISDFASRIIFPNHNMAGYGHPYVIHAANLVSRTTLACFCRQESVNGASLPGSCTAATAAAGTCQSCS